MSAIVQEFAGRQQTHSHARNVAIVVNQSPLMADEIESQDMIVDFVCVLIETAKCIDLVIAAIGYRRVDEARGSLSQGSRDLRAVPICR